jgi:hypothetical protein
MPYADQFSLDSFADFLIRWVEQANATPLPDGACAVNTAVIPSIVNFPPDKRRGI